MHFNTTVCEKAVERCCRSQAGGNLECVRQPGWPRTPRSLRTLPLRDRVVAENPAIDAAGRRAVSGHENKLAVQALPVRVLPLEANFGARELLDPRRPWLAHGFIAG